MTILTHRLDNGLRIITENMPSLQSAALGVWVLAGGRDEEPAETGVAHFLEHMAFKGTARRSARAIAEEIEDVGGYLNAYTSKEMTAYYARVLGADVPRALDLVADIVLNPAFAEEEIALERGVILQEIGQVNDTPDDVIFDWLQEVAYPDQSFGRPILGPARVVRQLGHAALTGFTARHYAPDRMILSAAGAVDHEAICRLAEELFGALPSAPARAPQPARFSGGERREIKPLEQAHFALSLEAPAYRDADLYAAQLHATALGGGMSSRLFQEVRERRGLCYTIHAQAAAYADTGHLTIYAGTGAEDLAELVAVVAQELGAAVDGLSAAELARARAQMKAGLLMGLESPSARSERMARMLSIWDRMVPVEEVVEAIDAVTLPHLREYSARLLNGVPAVALYGPVESAPHHTELAERLTA